LLSIPGILLGVKTRNIPTLDRRLVAVLRSAVKDLNLSARTYARILIVAHRTAEWAGADKIGTQHLLEAIQFCTLSDPA